MILGFVFLCCKNKIIKNGDCMAQIFVVPLQPKLNGLTKKQ
jgi:hypothetical protein